MPRKNTSKTACYQAKVAENTSSDAVPVVVVGDTMPPRNIRSNLKRSILYHAVSRFFDDLVNFAELQRLLARPFVYQKNISLRLLDYFLSVYASDHGVCITVNGRLKSFHDLYQTRLTSNGKVMYDAFRRTDKLSFTKHGATIETTLGQLLFFRDVIQYKVIDYVLKHADEIKACMSKDLPRGAAARVPPRRRADVRDGQHHNQAPLWSQVLRDLCLRRSHNNEV
jgi:hypothetical protein